MRRWGLLSLLLVAGCGGGGGSSSVSQTFDIVGKWKAITVQDNRDSATCPGSIPSGASCYANEGYEFRADHMFYNLEGGGGQYYDITDTVIFFHTTPREYSASTNLLRLFFDGYSVTYRKFQ